MDWLMTYGFMAFLAHLDEVQEELLYYPPALALVALSALAKSLMLKFFYVMGKALSCKLSCPCDSCC